MLFDFLGLYPYCGHKILTCPKPLTPKTGPEVSARRGGDEGNAANAAEPT